MNPDNDRSITDELLDGLIRKVKDLEGTIALMPNHAADFVQLTEQLKELKASYEQHDEIYPAEQIQNQLNELQKKIDIIPKVISVRHHFDVKSKGFIVGITVLLITVAIAVGIAISTTIGHKDLTNNADKFRMVRQTYPDAAKWADEVYHANPEAAMKLTDSLEALSETLAAAEREAEGLEKEHDLKRKKVKELRKVKQERIKKSK